MGTVEIFGKTLFLDEGAHLSNPVEWKKEVAREPAVRERVGEL